MPTAQDLSLFVAASVLLILTPGQDLYLVMTRSIAQGARAGVVTAAGISTGLLGHTLLVGLGLGAVIRASDTLFLALKLLGAAYLIWLGITLLRQSAATFESEGCTHLSAGRLYVHGALSNLVNPKIAVFYLAFLPQFVPVDSDSPTATLLVLGAAFAALTFIIKAPIGMAAGSASSVFRRNASMHAWVGRFSGGVLLLLGLRLLFERPSH